MNYKQTALDALRGNWKTAMLTGFVASMFGATTMYTGGGGSNSSSSEDGSLTQAVADYLNAPGAEGVLAIVIALVVALAIIAITGIFLGGAMRMGYARFNLNLIDHKPAAFSDLFLYMGYKWKGFVMNFLTGLFIGLWSLLLVIPGIVKSFSYAMTPFILTENPDMPPIEAITASREMMDGHKWDLFCLYLSFIGWNLLVSLPGLAAIVYTVFCAVEGAMGKALVGFVAAVVLIIVCAIPLVPYMEAANAAFYRDISGREKSYTLISE